MYARYLVLFNMNQGPPPGGIPEALLTEIQGRLPPEWRAWVETAATGSTRRVTSIAHWVDFAVGGRAPDEDPVYHDAIIPAESIDGVLRADVGPINSRIVVGMQRRGATAYLWRGDRIVEVASFDKIKGGRHIAVGRDEPLLHGGGHREGPPAR